eukprot:gene12170-18809_t
MDTVAAFAALCAQLAPADESVKAELVAGFLSRFPGDRALAINLLLPQHAGGHPAASDADVTLLLAKAARCSPEH